MTNSPFDKWRLLSHIKDEATFIYLPNHKQSHLCNLQFGIYELLNSNNDTDRMNGHNLMKWLSKGQRYVRDNFGTAAPAAFYQSLKKLTPAQVSLVIDRNKNLFLLFNPALLSFDSNKKTFAEKLLFWRT